MGIDYKKKYLKYKNKYLEAKKIYGGSEGDKSQINKFVDDIDLKDLPSFDKITPEYVKSFLNKLSSQWADVNEDENSVFGLPPHWHNLLKDKLEEKIKALQSLKPPALSSETNKLQSLINIINEEKKTKKAKKGQGEVGKASKVESPTSVPDGTGGQGDMGASSSPSTVSPADGDKPVDPVEQNTGDGPTSAPPASGVDTASPQTSLPGRTDNTVAGEDAQREQAATVLQARYRGEQVRRDLQKIDVLARELSEEDKDSIFAEAFIEIKKKLEKTAASTDLNTLFTECDMFKNILFKLLENVEDTDTNKLLATKIRNKVTDMVTTLKKEQEATAAQAKAE